MASLCLAQHAKNHTSEEYKNYNSQMSLIAGHDCVVSWSDLLLVLVFIAAGVPGRICKCIPLQNVDIFFHLLQATLRFLDFYTP